MHRPDQFFVGLIPDGGRRAAGKDLARYAEKYGRGAEVVGDTLKACVKDSRIRVFAAWGLSDDNASKRSPAELDILNGIFREYLDKLRADLETPDYEQVKVVHLGDEECLDPSVLSRIHDVTSFSARRTEKVFGLCLGYGAHNEMDRAVERAYMRDSRDWRRYLDLPFRGGESYQHVDAIVRTGTNPLKPYTSAYLLPYQGPGTQERYIEDYLPNVTAERIMEQVDDVWRSANKQRLGA